MKLKKAKKANKEKRRNWHDYIGLVGMFLIPLAPAVATGWAVYEWLLLKGVLLPLAIIAGCASGPGMEAFLAITGDTLLTLKPKENKAWFIIIGIMVIYPIVGLSYYGFNVVGMLFVMAVLFYVVTAIRRQVTMKVEQELEADTLQYQTERDQLAWQREQQALQLAHHRELERLKWEAAQPSSPPLAPVILKRKSEQLSTPTAEAWDKYTRWDTVPDEVRHKLAEMEKAQFKAAFTHLSDSTRKRWWRDLGAYRDA